MRHYMRHFAPEVRLTDKLSAHHYKRFPEVLFTRAHDVWLYDNRGNKYLDMLSAYSAVGVGHNHPRIKEIFKKPLPVLGHPYYTNTEAYFLQRLTATADTEAALLMNTGAEAVETALKLARKWAYVRKGIERDKAEIIVADNNFHGRTTTIVSFSTDEVSRKFFGPYAPGFKHVPFGDFPALAKAITPNTAAVLLEPVQGEGGVVVPPDGYLSEVKNLCDNRDILLMLDEIQTGFGRTGTMFCHQHERSAKPDALIVGKALGGGVYPVSAVLSSRSLMDVFEPGEHGSTWGGNAFACAIANEALKIIEDENLVNKSFVNGIYLREKIRDLKSPFIKEVRGKGLLVGVELTSDAGDADDLCAELLRRGAVAKGAHKTVLRLAPPLTITTKHIDYFIAIFKNLLKQKESSL